MRRGILFATAATLMVALPAPALGQGKLFQDYRRDGVVNPCNYSPQQLQQGLKNLPPDVRQYVPGLGDQLRRSCPTNSPPALQQQQQAVPAAAGGTAPPPPPKPELVVPRPPAPNVSQPKRLGGVAPAIAQQPVDELPDWLAALVMALLVGGFAGVLAWRYGALSLDGFGRRLKGSSVEVGEWIGDGFAAIGDRLRFR